MSINAMLDAIVAATKDALPSIPRVYPYDGQYGEADLARFATVAPAVFVSIVGFGETDDQADDLIAPGQWVMTIVTKRTSGDVLDPTRLKAAVGILETLTSLVRDSNSESGAWPDESMGAPRNIRAKNIHGPGLDIKGLTMWLLTWEQDVSLVAFDTETLDNLLTLRGEMDLSTDNTYDVRTTVDGAS